MSSPDDPPYSPLLPKPLTPEELQELALECGEDNLDAADDLNRLLAYTSIPDPYKESDIEPTLLAFRRGEPETKIDYDSDDPSKSTENILLEKGFLDLHRVVFIVHGFKNNNNARWMHDMKDAILERADNTVILVGWGKGAKLWAISYGYAAANTQVVGKWLGKLAAAISKRVSNIWGIGHSLGAHVLGKAGRDSGAFKRITGLDPAGPKFEQVNEGIMLQRTDADFVDVIHTDGYVGMLSPVVHFGTLLPLGDVDFYPNYGLSPQPGCYKGGSGSHSRAVTYFTWSILHPESFKTEMLLSKQPMFQDIDQTTKVGPMAQMGYYADQHNLSGNYYLPTESKEPWVI